MKKVVLFLAAVMMAAVGVFADEPFRLHRYDSFKVLPVGNQDVVFVGNSITDMHCWDEAWGCTGTVLNRGNSGAFTYEILSNIETYIAGHPKKLFLMIGTNDMGTNSSNATITNNIRLILKRITTESPNTEVYVEAILQSTSGSRTLANISSCNAMIKEMVGTEYADKKVTYVNLYDAVTGIPDKKNSFDALHITAAGYKQWMDELTRIGAMEGYTCQYPDKPTSTYTGMAYNSNGMRSTYFANLPISKDDVLFIGDELVKCGEWQELLGNPNVKNRGYGWGYAGPDMNSVLSSLPLIIKGGTGSVEPKQVVLYTGSQDVISGGISTLKSTYGRIVTKVRSLCPNAKITLVGIAPTQTVATNKGNITKLNEHIKSLAEADDNASYCDIYSALVDPETNKGSDEYMNGTNYLYGMGYAKVANLLAEHIDGCKPITMEEAKANYDLIQARTVLSNAISAAEAMADAVEGQEELNALIADGCAALVNGDKTIDEMLALAEQITMKLAARYDIKTGWYQIKNEVSNFLDRETNLYLHALDEGVVRSNGVYDVQAVDDKTSISSLVYVDFLGIAVDGLNVSLRLQTGAYIGAAGCHADNPLSIKLSILDENDPGALHVYANNNLDLFEENGKTLLGAGARCTTSTFRFYSADDMMEKLVPYTVVYSSHIVDRPKLKYNKEGYTGNTVFSAGGTVFVPVGETLLADDFTCDKSSGIETVLRIDDEARTITIDTKGTPLTELVYARAAVADEVGAIAERESEDYLKLVGLVEYFKDYGAEGKLTDAAAVKFDELKTLLAAYVDANADNIILPEVGATYRMAVVSSQATQLREKVGYYTYADAGTFLDTSCEQNENNLIKCESKTEDGHFVFKFVSNDKYLIWRGMNSGENGNKGYADAYEDNYGSFAIANIVQTQYAVYDNVHMVGLVSVTSDNRSSSNSTAGCLGFYDNGTGAWAQANAPFFNGSFTSAFQFETVEKAVPDGIDGVGAASGNAAIYNLNGQKMSAPQRGVNIINGKKMVM